jgi:hypothetical protein
MLGKKKPPSGKVKLTKSEKLLDLSKDPAKKSSGKPVSRKVRAALGERWRWLTGGAQDFKEIKLIGRGNVGKVYLVRLRGTNGEGAVGCWGVG